MGGDDDRKWQGPGADLFEQARQRAEAFLREVSNLGGSTQQHAGERVDQLWSVGRWSADQLMEAIRHEVAAQLGSLGLATKADLDDLERRLTAGAGDAAAAAKSTGAKKAAAAKKTAAAKKAPAAQKSTAAKGTVKKAAAGNPTPNKAAAKKAPSKKATGPRKAAGS